MNLEVSNCSWQFKVQCPLKWQALDATADDRVRFCGVCMQNVYRCETDAEIQRHRDEGHCVAIIKQDDESHGYVQTLGLLDYPEDE